MARTHRVSMIAVVVVCFVAAQWNATLFASDDTDSSKGAPSSSIDQQSTDTDVASTSPAVIEPPRLKFDADLFAARSSLGPVTESTFRLEPTLFSARAGQIYQGRPYRMGRNGSIAALMAGAAATIAGTALLVYANRPDCTTNESAAGCGYGIKVIGGSVLAGGVVGLFIGALTWR